MSNLLGRQRGLGAIAAIAILSILAVLSAALVALTTGQQAAATQDMLAARAWQAAKAGHEWALEASQLANWTCPAVPGAAATTSSGSLDLRGLTGFMVNISVTCWLYDESGVQSSMLRIESVACNAAACPVADASGSNYVERSRVVISFR